MPSARDIARADYAGSGRTRRDWVRYVATVDVLRDIDTTLADIDPDGTMARAYAERVAQRERVTARRARR